MKKISLFFVLLIYMTLAYSNNLLPSSLNERNIFFKIDGSKSEDNPNAGLSYIMSFSKEKYAYQIIDTSMVIRGNSYRYENLEGEAHIEFNEIFNKKVTRYKIILYPVTGGNGIYRYIQTEGGVSPGERENMGKYTLDIIDVR